MSTNEKPFSPITWGGQDPHGVTTGHNQADAGRGQHFAERVHRAHQVAQGPVPLRPETLPLPVGLNDVEAFVSEVQAAERAKRHFGTKVVAGVLGYQIAKRALQNRGRR